MHCYDRRSRHGRSVRYDGKRPRNANWAAREYLVSSVVKQCIAENRSAGVRPIAQQLVIEVDRRNGGVQGFKQLCQQLTLDPSTWPITSARRRWPKRNRSRLDLQGSIARPQRVAQLS